MIHVLGFMVHGWLLVHCYGWLLFFMFHGSLFHLVFAKLEMLKVQLLDQSVFIKILCQKIDQDQVMTCLSCLRKLTSFLV